MQVSCPRRGWVTGAAGEAGGGGVGWGVGGGARAVVSHSLADALREHRSLVSGASVATPA